MLGIIKKLFKQQTIKSAEPDIVNQIVHSGKDQISKSSMLFNEQVFGDLYCLEDIHIELNGDVCGNVTSKRCILKGRVTGEIISTEYVSIKSTAVIEGRIRSASADVELGAVINGYITIQKDLNSPELIKRVEEGYLNPEANPVTPATIVVNLPKERTEEFEQVISNVTKDEPDASSKKEVNAPDNKLTEIFKNDNEHWW